MSALPREGAEHPPTIGARVELRGLVSKPELNGRCGTVVAWDAAKGRAAVKIGSRPPLSLKPSSLHVIALEEAATFECAICWADVAGSPAELPCCGAPPPGSSTSYCTRCIEIICEQALGGMGRCPTCREFIQVADGGHIEVAAGLEMCAVCNQARPVAERMGRPERPLCGACAMGVRRPLRYECERCHRVGPVPHPMYRYQATPGEFGNNPWFCQPCADFTNRRLVPHDLSRVPAEDSPESWGRRDEWLAQVREQRQREAEAAAAAADAAATEEEAAAQGEDTAEPAASAQNAVVGADVAARTGWRPLRDRMAWALAAVAVGGAWLWMRAS